MTKKTKIFLIFSFSFHSFSGCAPFNDQTQRENSCVQDAGTNQLIFWGMVPLAEGGLEQKVFRVLPSGEIESFSNPILGSHWTDENVAFPTATASCGSLVATYDSVSHFLSIVDFSSSPKLVSSVEVPRGYRETSQDMSLSFKNPNQVLFRNRRNEVLQYDLNSNSIETLGVVDGDVFSLNSQNDLSLVGELDLVVGITHLEVSPLQNRFQQNEVVQQVQANLDCLVADAKLVEASIYVLCLDADGTRLMQLSLYTGEILQEKLLSNEPGLIDHEFWVQGEYLFIEHHRAQKIEVVLAESLNEIVFVKTQFYTTYFDQTIAFLGDSFWGYDRSRQRFLQLDVQGDTIQEFPITYVFGLTPINF